MRLPGWLLTHRITVEPYLGASGAGPAYGPPVTVPCQAQPVKTTGRGREERTAGGRTQIIAQLDAPITPESRVTLDGRTVEVVSVVRRDGGGLPTPDHLEVTVQ